MRVNPTFVIENTSAVQSLIFWEMGGAGYHTNLVIVEGLWTIFTPHKVKPDAKPNWLHPRFYVDPCNHGIKIKTAPIQVPIKEDMD